MEQLNAILQSELCLNLLSALLHSLWQGLIIAGILLLYLKSKTATNANTRYAASLIALSSILVCLLFTWSILNYEPAPTIQENAFTVESSKEINTIAAEPQRNQSAITPPEIQSTSTGFNWKPPVISLWLTGVLIMLFRAIYIIAGGARLQVQCDELKDERILEIVEKLRKSLRITRKIKVAVSEYVTVPGVIGFFSPLLLLPVSLITGVPDEALRAILAHEIAHIRRYDYFVNFCQMVIEAILFFNPAVWWISRQIRIEREVCCDNAGIAAIGRRIRYAEVLIGWAQKIKESNIETATVAIAFGKQNDGSMLERIKRIVSTNHRPGLKVSWHIAAITLLLSIVTLVGLWQGTNMTVAFAGKLLTPQERIDKITEISKEYGLEKSDYGSEDNIKVSGTIRTYDGKPLPKYTSLRIESKRSNYGASSSHDVHINSNSPDTAIFKASIEFGKFYVTASNDNYAAAFAGPFTAEPGGSVDDIELVMQEGFKTQIKITDETGNSIEAATIKAGYSIDGSCSYTINAKTDSNGIANIKHALNKKVAAIIEADGFESDRFENIVFEPEKVIKLTLRSSPPTTGIVTSLETGEPIPGAEVRIMKSTGNEMTNGINGKPEAMTDENGRFTLSKLRSDNQYLILIRAENYNREYLSNISAGNTNLKVALGPKKVIKGKITGDLEKLEKDSGNLPIIHYMQHYWFAHFSISEVTKKTPVIIKDGTGYFEIEECWGQDVIINAGDKKVTINVDEDSIDDIVVNLESDETKMRELVLNFITPENSPPIEGKIRLNYHTEESGYKMMWLDINDNQVRYNVAFDSTIRYEIDYRGGEKPIGYWFENPDSTKIPAGESPYVIEIPVYPAGAIFGNILLPDGKLVEKAKGFVFFVKKPEFVKDKLAISDALLSGGISDGKYNASPLPLGGKYQIVVYSKNRFMTTKQITLDNKTPIVKQNIQLAEGTIINGQLLDIAGSPASDYVRLNVSLEVEGHSWSTTLEQIKPDENGRFSIENINPDFLGEYFIEVTTRKGYRPVRQEITNFNKPITIQLQQGLKATGILVDNKTGWPIPGVEIGVYRVYQDGNKRMYSERINADNPTDYNGQFIFSSLAEGSYDLTFTEVNSKKRYTITSSQKAPVIVKVDIPENSNLKPRKPD